MTTAFVFAGGGSLGAIQAGALAALTAAGERPDFVVGTSVGALNACYYAGRPDAAGVDAMAKVWRGLSRQDVFPVTPGSILQFLQGRGSLFGASGLRQIVERHLPFENIENAVLPVHVVATDLTGESVCLSSGPAAAAVLASAAIPVAFPPVRVGERELMDGAIAGNTPILTAAALGATRIVVLQTGYACSMHAPPSSAVARGLHALTLLIANQMDRDLRLVGPNVSVHVTPHLCPLDVSPFDFSRAAELIERSRGLTAAWIDAGGLGAPSGSDAIIHDHVPGHAMGPAMPRGFDPVSYFNLTGPVEGLPDISLVHGGVRHHFADAANRDAFLADPERFLPEYGGHCAFAMARGMTIKGNPRVHALVDGRLYFNLNPKVHAAWLADAGAMIARADAAWDGRRETKSDPKGLVGA
jgi:NTE family protein